ncbi:hypothetical protein ASE14_13385 [Agromyces sp. Root81]|uniref:GbsR/MarR family transcriptional regulator n=1 Tax=Agromyces sp. Root81 TaxID=1736601 RepID=UPI0006FF52AB|nr:helix-turn-helix domain-containing protein [Agromyces sp. Root81]KRC61801.1 hypothetical protein ASE14_13385 [Agromyces sp. Root81]
MPGGRLTLDERRAIEAGIAEDLGYAQIARQIERPTSTVTREVVRNGGARGYRAEHAQTATHDRARRHGVDRADVAEASEVSALQPELDAFTDLLVATGLPRTASRVLVALYTTESSNLTARDLVAGLGVSAASISKAVGFLEAGGLVQRDVDAGTRRERYGLGDDIWEQSWAASRRANELWAIGAAELAGRYPESSRVRRRFEEAAEFFERLSRQMAGGPGPAVEPGLAETLKALARGGAPLTASQLEAALTPQQRRVLAGDSARS